MRPARCRYNAPCSATVVVAVAAFAPCSSAQLRYAVAVVPEAALNGFWSGSIFGAENALVSSQSRPRMEQEAISTSACALSAPLGFRYTESIPLPRMGATGLWPLNCWLYWVCQGGLAAEQA